MISKRKSRQTPNCSPLRIILAFDLACLKSRLQSQFWLWEGQSCLVICSQNLGYLWCKKYKRNRRITMSCWCNLRNLRMAWLRYGRGGFNTEWRSLGEWKNMDIYWTMNNGHGEDFVHCKHRSQLGMEGPWWLGLTRTPERPSGPSGTSSRLNRCRGPAWILQIQIINKTLFSSSF